MVEKPDIEFLKKQAKDLKRRIVRGDKHALARFAAVHKQAHANNRADNNHANCLHVIAVENGYENWPKLKLSIETRMMTRKQRIHHLELALFNGQFHLVEKLFSLDPALADANFGLQIALCKRDVVFAQLDTDPSMATARIGDKTALLHLCYSKYFQHKPSVIDDMLAIAERLISMGANVDDTYAWSDGSPLSALYGALCHADNHQLAALLLSHGANPNDDESLYHATELGHHQALHLLMKSGVDINANHHWIRMLDFDDLAGAQLLLENGANANPVMPDGTIVSTLHHAIKRGRDGRFARLLIQYGADTQCLENGHTAYGFAYIHNNQSMLDALVDLGCKTELSQAELFMGALTRGDRQVALTMCESNTDILGQLHPKDLEIPSALAIRPNTEDALRIMRDVGIDLNTVDDGFGMPPVHSAAWFGQAKNLTFFLTLKPDLEQTNYYGGTVLGTAIHGSFNCPDRLQGDYIACIEMLVEAGSKILPDQGHLIMGSEEVCLFVEDLAQ